MKNTDENNKNEAVICAVASGKGGVGKSVIISNIAIQLAKLGKRVTLLDLDLGGASLQTIMGVEKPEYNLSDFISKTKTSLNEITVETQVKNLKFISSTSGILTMANLVYAQKQKIINQLKKLDADIILLDLGAGSSFNVLDFFLEADLKLIVLTPEPTSVQNSYGFLKNALYRLMIRSFSKDEKILTLINHAVNPGLENKIGSFSMLLKKIEAISRKKTLLAYDILSTFRPNVIMNMVSDNNDTICLKTIQKVAQKYLNIDVNFLGNLNFDKDVRLSVVKMKPILLNEENNNFSAEILNITKKLLSALEKKTIYGKNINSNKNFKRVA